MAIELRWANEEDRDRVALARARAYAPAAKDLTTYLERIRLDPRATAGDFLLAEDAGEPVGTATSLSMTMWLRGGHVFCQGVAYVGTVRTHRRGGTGDSPGIATRLMQETIQRARDRGQALSALMPFRNSFYEHFGYGVVERRCDWTLPLATLPKGPFDGIRYYRATDLDALAACRQRMVCRGQADLKRTRQAWEYFLRRGEDGFFVVDRPDAAGPIRGYAGYVLKSVGGKPCLDIGDLGYDDVDALRRLLGMFASLKDQYHALTLTLPADLPVNRLLRETQIPHKPVVHATADCRSYTRMQVKILDHKQALEAMSTLPAAVSGKAVVAVKEVEGHTSRFAVDLSAGRAAVSPSDATPQFQCADTTWAAVALGDLGATQAVRLGLATCDSPAALAALDALAQGPAPFCNEPF